MKPTVARIVHYWSHGSADGVYKPECRAAIVTEVSGAGANLPDGRIWKISLAVFNPEGMFFNQDIYQDEQQERGGTWHWPEREFDDFDKWALKSATKLAANPDVIRQVTELVAEKDDDGKDCSA